MLLIVMLKSRFQPSHDGNRIMPNGLMDIFAFEVFNKSLDHPVTLGLWAGIFY
jgi:hypothetical protein